MSNSSSLVIEELSSNGTDVRRSVTLYGPALPFMGAEWAGSNQLVTTWYPGNPDDATQQNLGARELPSKWNGDWRRTMMGTAPTTYVDENGGINSIVDPSVLRDALEGIFRAGRRLRVTWAVEDVATVGAFQSGANISGKIVREGRAKEWHWKHTRIHDIEWEIDFEWTGRKATTTRVANTRDNTVQSQSAAYMAALQKLTDLQTAAQQAKFKPQSLTMGQLESLANAPTLAFQQVSRNVLQLQHQLSDLVNVANTLAQQPLQITGAAQAHARNSRAIVRQTYAQLSLTSAELFSSKHQAVDVLRAYKQYSQVQDSARDAAKAATDFLATMQASDPKHSPPLSGRLNPASTANASTVQTIYICKQGDTPKRVSQIHYGGSPDHDVDILRANRLSWYLATFAKGQILIIPQLPTNSKTV